MFKKVKVNSRESYLASISKEHKEDFISLDKFIQKAVPKLQPYFAYNMLGYGSFSAKNYKKEIIDWPTVALADQKNYMSLYICSVENGNYIAENYKQELGNVIVGKTCIRFKKISDFKLTTLKKVLQKAQKSPGLTGLNTH